MITATRTPSKQEEIDQLSEIVNSLPDGYLRDILKDMQPNIVRTIRNDQCWISLQGIIDERIEEDRKLQAARKELMKLEDDARNLRGKIDRHTKALSMIREDSEFIVRQLNDYRD